MPTGSTPSQGERRRARTYQREYGVRFADALRAVKAERDGSPPKRYLYVPFPPPRLDTADPGCSGCGGTGVNGTLYAAIEHAGQVLLCDQVCADCEGCGSSWCACAPLWLDDGRGEDRADEDMEHAEAGFEVCFSCRDRGFTLVQTFVRDDLNADPRPLRIPCGCVEAFAFDVTGELIQEASRCKRA